MIFLSPQHSGWISPATSLGNPHFSGFVKSSITFRLFLLPVLITLLLPSQNLHAQDLPDSVFTGIARFARTRSDGYQQLSRACTEIGHRLTGSENGIRAEEWMHAAFLAKGNLRVEFFPFPIRTWKRGSCTLEIAAGKSDHFMPMKSVSLANAGSGSGLFKIVDAGDGLEADFIQKASSISGNCVLMNLGLTGKDSSRQNLHRAEKVSLAIRYGAAAVLFVHPREAGMVLTGTAALSGKPVEIPALCISGEGGNEIRKWLDERPLVAEINVKNEISEGKARNVMALLKADSVTDESILVCGHLDSWDLGTGAVDNGLGAFTIPDIAAAIQQYRSSLKRNVIFLLTMGEEQGLLGSRAVVKQWLEDGRLGNIKAVVNMDMVGNPISINDFDWPSASDFFQGTDSVIARNLPSFTGKRNHAPGLHSDHQPFMLEGIPSFSMNSSLPDSVYHCYHADCDNIELVKESYMKNSAIAHSIMIMDLASRKELGFQRMKPKMLAKWLKSHRLKEKLEISGEWKWN